MKTTFGLAIAAAIAGTSLTVPAAHAYDPPLRVAGLITAPAKIQTGSVAPLKLQIRLLNGKTPAGGSPATIGRVRIVVKAGPEGHLTQRHVYLRSMSLGRTVSMVTPRLLRSGTYRVVMLFVPKDKSAYTKAKAVRTIRVR